MEHGLASYFLGYASGVLSTLSPCVLPLLPIVLGSAGTVGRLGPFALTAGVMTSFSVIGIILATAGTALGFNEDAFRSLAAALLVVMGLVLMAPAIQQRLSVLASGISNAGHNVLGRLKLEGNRGQFVIGLVLGSVWSPCIGPTLGAAIVLASQGKDQGSAAVLMVLYGLGAGTPMLALGSVSRTVAARFRGKLLAVGNTGKYVLGGSLCVLGVLTLSGLDKTLEALAVQHSPAWLLNLTTTI